MTKSRSLKQELRRHRRTLEKLQLRSSRPSEFAESSGNLPGMARSSTCVARCPSATASGVVGTSSRDRRVSDWEPTADHYPRLKMHGGHLTPDNVRLAHRLCNQRDYMADEDQRDAREADVAGGDRREAERGEGSNDPRHEQMDSCICSEGIRFLEAPFARPSRPAARTLSPPGAGCLKTAPPRSRMASRDTAPALPPDAGRPVQRRWRGHRLTVVNAPVMPRGGVKRAPLVVAG